MVKKYPRDMVGYGSKNTKVIWPNNAKLALQIVLNYEEGAENSVLPSWSLLTNQSFL